MEIIVHGTKDGYRTFYATSIELSDSSRVLGNNENSIGSEAYSIEYLENNYIFSKYRIVYDDEGDNRTGFLAFAIAIPNTEKLDGNQIYQFLNELADKYTESYMPSNPNKLYAVREDWSFLDNIKYKYNPAKVPSYSIPKFDKECNAIPYSFYQGEAELINIFNEPHKPEISKYKKIYFVDYKYKLRDDGPLSSLQHDPEHEIFFNNSSSKINLYLDDCEFLKEHYYNNDKISNKATLQVYTSDKLKFIFRKENHIDIIWENELNKLIDEKKVIEEDTSRLNHYKLNFDPKLFTKKYKSIKVDIEGQIPETFILSDIILVCNEKSYKINTRALYDIEIEDFKNSKNAISIEVVNGFKIDPISFELDDQQESEIKIRISKLIKYKITCYHKNEKGKEQKLNNCFIEIYKDNEYKENIQNGSDYEIADNDLKEHNWELKVEHPEYVGKKIDLKNQNGLKNQNDVKIILEKENKTKKNQDEIFKFDSWLPKLLICLICIFIISLAWYMIYNYSNVEKDRQIDIRPLTEYMDGNELKLLKLQDFKKKYCENLEKSNSKSFEDVNFLRSIANIFSSSEVTDSNCERLDKLIKFREHLNKGNVDSLISYYKDLGDSNLKDVILMLDSSSGEVKKYVEKEMKMKVNNISDKNLDEVTDFIKEKITKANKKFEKVPSSQDQNQNQDTNNFQPDRAPLIESSPLEKSKAEPESLISLSISDLDKEFLEVLKKTEIKSEDLENQKRLYENSGIKSGANFRYLNKLIYQTSDYKNPNTIPHNTRKKFSSIDDFINYKEK